jgi:hypothetical protein
MRSTNEEQIMTTQEARDIFLRLRYQDGEISALGDIYEATNEGFQAWLDDNSIGLDD